MESGAAPATVFQSTMMNYFDRDNQDEMLMRCVSEEGVAARLAPPMGKGDG